jgi:hypothetical protein
MPFIKTAVFLFLSSCSPTPQNKSDLPNYSNMSASDASTGAAFTILEG